MRFATIRPGEGRAVAWSFAYFFMLLAAYYVLRPLRDQAGIAGGVRNLPWLFTATFVVMLVLQPAYGAVVAAFARARFIPIVYHFFAINLAIFWALLTLHVAPVVIARVFFVWISVFNLFAVSVFWSFMADLFTGAQGKRLFGLIGAGGTAGSLLGPVIALWLAGPLGPVNLLLIATVLLESAVLCARRLERAAAALETAEASGPARQSRDEGQRNIGGGWLAGLTQLLRSPYLAGIALWVSFLSFAGTILYFEQAKMVAAASHNAATQTRIFAGIDLAVALMSLAAQALASGRLITRIGVAGAVALQPAIFVLGFSALALFPRLGVVMAFQALQRTANFAISNLGRQILFTSVGREDKYKSKNVIDVVVFRGSDAFYGWVYQLLRGLGLGVAALSAVAIPVAVCWAGLGLMLGRAHERRAARTDEGG
jgi:AAA family ATP:ADP antiporter